MTVNNSVHPMPNPGKKTNIAGSNQIKLKSFFLPFFTTTLSQDIQLFFLLQPIFWIIGIEHFAPVIIALWMIVKKIIIAAKIRVPIHGWLLLLLLIWQIAHVTSIPPGELDLFIKSQSTLLTPLCLLLIIYNVADTQEKWKQILICLERFGFVLLLFGTLFILGWNGEFQSLIGYVLPKNIVTASHFFSSIAARTLGVPEPATGFRRVQSLLWHPNGYGTVLLIIIAIQYYFLQTGSLRSRIIRSFTILLALVNLYFTYSRTAYVAFLVMILLAWWLLTYSNQSRWVKIIILGLVITIIGLYILFLLLLQGTLNFSTAASLIDDFIYKIRPYSIQVRLQIYVESWKLIIQKPFWGWGTLVKIENLPTYFSAGSHSDFLSALFLYGIPGFLMYMGFICATWYILIKGYITTRQRSPKSFFALSIALMLAINLRQLTAGLLWDIYVGSTVWAIWAIGLALFSIQKKAKQLP